MSFELCETSFLRATAGRLRRPSLLLIELRMSPRELTRAKKFWHDIFGAVKMVRCSVNKVCRALFWHPCQFHPSRAKNFLWCKPGLKRLTDSTRHKSLLRRPAYSNPVVTCSGERCSRFRVQLACENRRFCSLIAAGGRFARIEKPSPCSLFHPPRWWWKVVQ